MNNFSKRILLIITGTYLIATKALFLNNITYFKPIFSMRKFKFI